MYEALYETNRGLLYAVARRYAGACERDRALSVEDLVQAGFFGLVKAAKSYDTGKGSSWPVWAARYIGKEIVNALGYRWQPSTDGGPGHYQQTKTHTGAFSLDAPIADDDPDGATWVDTLPDDSLPDVDQAVNLEAVQTAVREAVERLQSNQQREVVTMCDLQGQSYHAASEALGVSGERVRQIRGAALKKLRRDRQLKVAAETDLELRTPYYAKVGINEFRSTHTSAVEKAVLWRLKHEEQRRHIDDILEKHGDTTDDLTGTPAERNGSNEQRDQESV